MAPSHRLGWYRWCRPIPPIMAPSLTAANTRVLLVLSVAGHACAGGPDRTTAVRQWADYYATVYAVPPELVKAIIEVESGWQPTAVSGKGAAGLMQLMPETAVELGVTNRFDVQQNIQAGVAYLAHLGRFHGRRSARGGCVCFRRRPNPLRGSPLFECHRL